MHETNSNAEFASWASATHGTMSQTGRRAAIWVWVIGAMQLMLSSCFLLMFAALALIPPQMLLNEMHGQYSADEIALIYQAVWPSIIVLGLGGSLPGIVYLALGFAVWAGRRPAIITAMVMVITQCIVLGLLLVTQVVAAVLTADPAALTSGVLLFGTPLAVLGRGWFWLHRHNRLHRHHADQLTDPWRDSTPPYAQ